LKYRYLPVFGIGVLGITGITVFEKVGMFAIPTHNTLKKLFKPSKNHQKTPKKTKKKRIKNLLDSATCLLDSIGKNEIHKNHFSYEFCSCDPQELEQKRLVLDLSSTYIYSQRSMSTAQN
jgi:hypothetical protein